MLLKNAEHKSTTTELKMEVYLKSLENYPILSVL